ncbi:hypothetical protein GDO78_020273 [Eleutherodactylus coqui]|uniref:Uncharacterized protein n=1 Tax=Eleutherodactylus coqui TaxID=57060 RepID=A0A8J6BIN4_ELECQ|nr:hypothetical protein GDO78_020273 [Eleutherodactylus coqui]
MRRREDFLAGVSGGIRFLQLSSMKGSFSKTKNVPTNSTKSGISSDSPPTTYTHNGYQLSLISISTEETSFSRKIKDWPKYKHISYASTFINS